MGIFLPWGPALNVNSMVFMGLPGGIDYALLVGVKLKVHVTRPCAAPSLPHPPATLLSLLALFLLAFGRFLLPFLRPISPSRPSLLLKVIKPGFEKDFNQSLNVWLRCPGAPRTSQTSWSAYSRLPSQVVDSSRVAAQAA